MDVEIMKKYALGLLFIFSLTLPASARKLSVDTAEPSTPVPKVDNDGVVQLGAAGINNP